MYLDVIPNFAPLPAVRGLGRIIPVPRVISRNRGFGQTPEQTAIAGGITPTAINLQAALNAWVASLAAESPADAAVGCGPSGGAPCTSPEEAAQQIYAQAASICAEAGSAESLVGSLDPNCADNGQALAGQMLPQVESIFAGFPPATWTTEAANAASGNYYGSAPAGPCPAGQFVQVGPNGVTCYGNTANQDLQNTPIASPVSTPSAPVQATYSQPSPVTATLTNVSRPGQGFEAGDQFQLVIQGPPNAAVTGSSSQNGGPTSSSSYGSTNASGQLTIMGTFSQGNVGSWVESWSVAGGTTAQLSFTVANMGTSQPTGSTAISSTPVSASLPASSPLSFLTNSVSLFGAEIPVWGIAAAGVALLLLLPGKR